MEIPANNMKTESIISNNAANAIYEPRFLFVCLQVND
jgi:hypothetical protein